MGGGKIKKAVGITALSLILFTLLNVCVTVVVYNSFFERHERPDYAVTPGLCDYDRVDEFLPREEIYFKSGEAELCGYYYPADEPLGLVVLAHGYRAGADDYLPLTLRFVTDGDSVFTYDVRGTYNSGGESVKGMCQALIDIEAALDFVDSDERFLGLSVFLVGHSWGGYAVSSVLELHPDVAACVCIAPMADGSTVMVEMAEIHFSPIVRITKPIFDVYQDMLFGEYTDCNAKSGINSTDIPVLVAQGVDDDVITMDRLSITAYRDEITNPNVTYYFADGLQGGHSEILYSDEAILYREKLADDLALMEAELGRELSYEELTEFYSDVDHALYSELNEELVTLIYETFEKANK